MHNYRMAVTEREVASNKNCEDKDRCLYQVRNGCITMPDDYVKDHVIIYTRILRSVFYLVLCFTMLKGIF